jgi:hypothetical protein
MLANNLLAKQRMFRLCCDCLVKRFCFTFSNKSIRIVTQLPLKSLVPECC